MKKQVLLLLTFFSFYLLALSQKELTDQKRIVYETNVKDWHGITIKSIALDLYYPTGALANKKYPAVLFLHGGSFTGGNRLNISDACDQLADGGFVSIAIDYRTGYQQSGQTGKCHEDTTQLKEAIYRAMQDANAAWRFIVANADKYFIDTANLFVAGASAGADLANYDTYVNDSVASILFAGFADKLGTLQTSGNNFPANYTVKGICNMWGGMPAMPSGNELISASYRAYPTIMFKGGRDLGLTDGYGNFSGCPNAPRIYSGKAIYDYLRALNVPSVYHLSPKAGHSAYDDVFCMNQTICFFNSLINHTPYSGYYTYYNSSCH